ncbi:hypothetical protein [Nostoc sp.]|uniref:hypothetical protein n=1 Tax=Nostoc sp. TaxID=1180 RepID=UPI002FF9BB94
MCKLKAQQLRLFPISPKSGNVNCLSYAAQQLTRYLYTKIFSLQEDIRAIAGVAVLPSIILDVSVTTVSTFSPLNFSRSNQVDNTASSTDVCVQL